jgi:hypothetical protein
MGTTMRLSNIPLSFRLDKIAPSRCTKLFARLSSTPGGAIQRSLTPPAAAITLAALLTGCAGLQTDAEDKQSATAQTNSSPTRCQTEYNQGAPDGVYIALAKASSSEESLRLALGDIANQRQISIQSEATSSQHKTDGVSTQSFSKRVRSASEFVFDDYQVLCQDFVSNETLVRFDDRDLTTRINALLLQHYAATGWHINGSKNLLASEALKNILAAEGIAPQSLSASLSRNSLGWVLVLNNHRIKLRNEEWRLLFTLPPEWAGDSALSISDEFGKPLTQALHHEQEFRFNLTGANKNARYLSLFYIQPDGKVVAVRNNLPQEIKKTIMIPPEPGIFTAELPDGYDMVIDDYIIIASKNPIRPPASPWLFSGWDTLFDNPDVLGIRLIVR